MAVTTVHEIQLRPAGVIPLTGHDVPVDFIVTPERVIDCRPHRGPRPAAGICWDDLTEEKIAAIPLLAAQRQARRPGPGCGAARPAAIPRRAPRPGRGRGWVGAPGGGVGCARRVRAPEGDRAQDEAARTP